MKYLIALLFLFITAAFAAEPAYWMKSYPGATKAQTAHCLTVADAAYEAAHTGGPGLNGAAVLAKGNAWERCMEGK